MFFRFWVFRVFSSSRSYHSAGGREWVGGGADLAYWRGIFMGNLAWSPIQSEQPLTSKLHGKGCDANSGLRSFQLCHQMSSKVQSSLWDSPFKTQVVPKWSEITWLSQRGREQSCLDTWPTLITSPSLRSLPFFVAFFNASRSHHSAGGQADLAYWRGIFMGNLVWPPAQSEWPLTSKLYGNGCDAYSGHRFIHLGHQMPSKAHSSSWDSPFKTQVQWNKLA